MSETYTPPPTVKKAAQKALDWKKEGKSKGAGTPTGWRRASQLASGKDVSLSIVKRMHSYFSRHEVDKKGKDFNSTSSPSKGRVMWEAWGGNAGQAWAKKIAGQADKKK